MNKMVNLLMSESIPSGCEGLVMSHTMNFLDCYDEFIRYRTPESGTPIWLSRYNFLCLLNLPHAVDRFGPPRLNYEGSSIGEGFLPFLKPLLKMGMRPNWARAMLTTFYTKRAVDLVVRDSKRSLRKDPSSNDIDQEEPQPRKQFRCYKSVEEAETDFELGYPLSVALLLSGDFGCILGKDMHNTMRFQFSDWIEEFVGLHYYLIYPFIHEPKPIADGVTVLLCGLFLPKLGPKPFRGKKHVPTWTFIGSRNETFNSSHQISSLYNVHSISSNQIRSGSLVR